ncbi:hypothetical protein [Nonomuraea gerenzanensis]|uniref:Uncharacterized protein n=1 Tax=Nonomuraea gerenzanensis TaxID=93944 RepID=A0A1M4EMF2_9ACTN|nr:hypothetical protein [Nonomuraea gerenzanensis]UBU11510.1 hypothetical protein LCN96_45540 [Nonomuraea gerenzanensis]SBO99998.1 hypothetical protein BN4615_P9514 [Nonomuraea gerenzanensis]
MTLDLAKVRDRLVPLPLLHQVAALLNMPPLDETTTHGDPPIKQRTALYASIADWSWLSAQAAQRFGEPDDAPESAGRFAYLVEYTDQHAKGWYEAPGERSEGIILAQSAETVAQTVLTSYITHLAEYRDDYELWLVDSLSLRASVWHVDTAEAHRRYRRPSWPSSAHTFQETSVPPHAVEIRTPVQIGRLMDHHIEP